MKKHKHKWGIVADLVRELSNPSNSGIGLNDTDTERALQELANIMDTMMTQNCGFKKAVEIERENEEEFGEWIEQVIEIAKLNC